MGLFAEIPHPKKVGADKQEAQHVGHQDLFRL